MRNTPLHRSAASAAQKPSPAALLHICEAWGVAPSECIMVGDSPKVRPRAARPALDLECALPAPLLLRQTPKQGGMSKLAVGASCVTPKPLPPVTPPQDDIVCGNRAGALTVLLDVEGRYAPGSPDAPAGEAVPTHRVTSMGELRALLAERYDLAPPAGDAARGVAAAAAGGTA